MTLLPVRSWRFEPLPFVADLPELTHQGVRIPANANRRGPRAGRSRSRSTARAGRVGRFVLELEQGATGIQLPAEDRALAVALADQLGTVLASEVH